MILTGGLMTDDESRPKRLPTVYGPRGEVRRTPAGGVSTREFADRPITNVDMPIGDELAARIERTRSATKSSELAITSVLREQNRETDAIKGDLAEVKDTVTTLQIDVADMRGEMRGGLGEVRGAMRGLETVVRDLGERKQVTFAADVKIQETKAVTALEAPGHRWKFYAAAAALGAAAFELLKAVFG